MSNLLQTTQTTNTLKINTVVTLYDTVEIQVILPYYCKGTDGKYFKVISAEQTLKVAPLESYTSITLTGTHCFEKEIATAVKVSEDEFMDALEMALDNFTKSQEAA